MSNIGDFRALVAAATVDFTDQDSVSRSIVCKDSTALANSVQASGTPVRLLIPFSGRNESSSELVGFSMGNEVTTRWRFIDLFLLRPLPHALGLADSTYDLYEYASAYWTMMLALDLSTISDRMTITELRIDIPSFIEFPIGSGSFYLGAEVLWTVDEDDPL